jgi:hypothetical protein
MCVRLSMWIALGEVMELLPLGEAAGAHRLRLAKGSGPRLRRTPGSGHDHCRRAVAGDERLFQRLPESPGGNK